MASFSRRGQGRFQRYEFPYVDFHGRSYPLIPLTLKKGKFQVNTFALLDSGASISVFRPEIARALHIRPRREEAARLDTAAGGVDIGIAAVEILVEKTRFASKIGFSATYAANFNILGREGFFHRFNICFNEKHHTTVLTPISADRS